MAAAHGVVETPHVYLLRFDLRAPDDDAPARSARHRAAVDMARAVDGRGCSGIVLSEHHSSPDGYLPSPMVMAGAIAAATSTVPIVVAVSILPLHDPVRLAEDVVTLDHLSAGRAMVVLGLGYRPEEYQLFDVPFRDRGRVADQKLERLLGELDRAATATVRPRVTPAPYSSPRPVLAWGGGSAAAARRAGRFGVGFFAQTDAPGLREEYERAAADAGHAPGLCVLPSPEAPYAVFVADDVDEGWAEVGPALLVDAEAYREWNAGERRAGPTASLSNATTLEQLRDRAGAHRVVDRGEALDLVDRFGVVTLHPLCGGLDPALAWPYLERAVDTFDPLPARSD